MSSFKSPKVYFSFGLLILIVLAGNFSGNEFVQHLLFLALLYGGAASSWNILGGMAKQFSFGHAAFMGISGYISTFLFLDFGVSPWLGMIVGGIVATIVGSLMFYPSFRLREFYFAIATLAFLEIVRSVVTYWRVHAGGIDTYIPYDPSFANMIFEDKSSYILLAFAYLIIMLLIERAIVKSKFGYYLRAVGENEEAAEMLGVPGARIKYFAFVVSAFCVAIGGTIYTQYFLFVTPSMMFSVNLSLQMALMCIIGGSGTIAGPVIGAFLLIILDTFFRASLGQAVGELGFIIYGVLLISVVLYMPSGILPWLEKRFAFLWEKLPYLGGKTDEQAVESLQVLKEETVLKETAKPKDKNTVLLEVDTLSKHFSSLKAVDEVSFKVFEGEIVGLIGPNGSGKTTMYNLLTGFLKPNGGKITFKGTDVTELKGPSNFAHQGIARTFQIVKPFKGTTVLENVMVGALLKRNMLQARAFALNIIEKTGLSAYKDVKGGNLPIAICKRLELAKALATEPEILLLDETLAGLNQTEKVEVGKLLKTLPSQFNITLVIIEHDMRSMMELCERIVVLNYGKKIGDGTPAEISRNEEVIAAYLGQEAKEHATDQ